eukprot:CAMPEP_0197699114 /NCGR_PEP_ID=MMETSP1338-20131121/120190_1 /TAXON_ID=43686 ORGANISM="Pelagodinium beii, Strain RCC1491" /NCGR_SAMPLE_ID=MMETSP1338 /ASSEMBLY_ACC=CAM_ASM_000754 /LENGTH=86 /DNA_ID=CAMNT_0043282575 /DNA_START=319 /DNA_END=579 /DNA_ORIENTATION=-
MCGATRRGVPGRGASSRKLRASLAWWTSDVLCVSSVTCQGILAALDTKPAAAARAAKDCVASSNLECGRKTASSPFCKCLSGSGLG